MGYDGDMYIHIIIMGDNGTIGGLTIWLLVDITIVNGIYPLENHHPE